MYRKTEDNPEVRLNVPFKYLFSPQKSRALLKALLFFISVNKGSIRTLCS